VVLKRGIMSGLLGRVVVVTGGASGIGGAIVDRLARDGARVAIVDINVDAGSEKAEALGANVKFVHADITVLEAVEAAVDSIEKNFGPIWMLVNCAGWDKPAPFLSTGPDLWRKIIALNLYGPIHMHYAVCSRMAERNEGRVVNIASDAGRVGTSNEAVYSACKGGTISFTKSIARELARANILVNALCPGPTDTPAMAEVVGTGEEAEKWKDSMARGIPLRRMGKPDDYAGIVAFLGSEDAQYITGQTISVSGGLTMI